MKAYTDDLDYQGLVTAFENAIQLTPSVLCAY